MNTTNNIKTGTKKSRMPAKLDYFQSASGLILGLFMWGHMLMVSSILISKDFMYAVTKFFEGSFIIEGGAPILVSGFALFIFIVFISNLTFLLI